MTPQTSTRDGNPLEFAIIACCWSAAVFVKPPSVSCVLRAMTIERHSLLLTVATWCLALLGLEAAAADKVDFKTQIRPILVSRCVGCHGAKKQESGLRLDFRKPALAGGDSGVAIQSGKPAASLLLKRIRSADPNDRMPPKGKPLSGVQVALITRWISEGASWPEDGGIARSETDHWSFQPIHAPPVPEIAGKGIRNAIDRFVRARLKEHGLVAAPEANPNTLLRRLHLDLTGIPPTPAEITNFLVERRGDPEKAYSSAVDRLLKSPHFGERWALEWLDLARYADSDGYEKDLPRPHAFRWRDWLIDAINRDLPFDQFTEQQIAGDLLPGATDQVRLATGFHRNTLTNREGGVDQEEFRVKAVVDRVNTTFTVWMGLTVGCSECHSHKYDPITQREYYGLFAFFNNADEQDIKVAPSGKAGEQFQKKRREFQGQLAKIEAKIKEKTSSLGQRQRAWEASLKKQGGVWQDLEMPHLKASSGVALAIGTDRSIRVVGEPGNSETYTIEAITRLDRLSAIRLQALPDDSLPSRGPGRAVDGRFVLSGLTARVSSTSNGPLVNLPLSNARDLGRLEDATVLQSLEEGTPDGWNPKAAQPSTAVFEVASTVAKTGWVGNPLSGGVQDGAAQVFTVYAGSPAPASGSIDRLRYWSKSVKGAACGFYLLRPDGAGGFRVIQKHDIVSKGVGGATVELVLPVPWSVQRGDVLANSSNGGPGYRVGPSTDLVYFPVKRFPGKNQTVSLEKLPRFRESRRYFLQAHFRPTVPVDPGQLKRVDGTVRRVLIQLTQSKARQSLGRFRVQFTSVDDPLGLDRPQGVPSSILQIVTVPAGDRTPRQKKTLRDYYTTVDPVVAPLRKKLAEFKKKEPKLVATGHVMVRRGTPRTTHIHKRGNFLDRGAAVTEHTPSFLHPMAPRGQSADRLDLARWITSPKNPLTARVAANQVWKQLFGRGLVATSEDFGTQGAVPTHPEMLDWLATRFQELGWSRKRFIRLIVMSGTYRQSSAAVAEQLKRDPLNQWLARQNRFRLSGELIRDQYLAAAGILNPRVGGRSFRPPLPPGAKAIQFVNKWTEDKGEELRRRGLYIHLQRNLMLPMLMTFDRPDGIVSCTRRERSNTPLQALTLLNGSIFVDAARQLGRQLAESDESLSERIRTAYLRTLGREPSQFEAERVQKLHSQLSKLFQNDKQAAAQLTEGLGVETPMVEETAAWVTVARTLLNLDEVITRE